MIGTELLYPMLLQPIIGFVFARQWEHGTWHIEASLPIEPVPKKGSINLFKIDGSLVPQALKHYDHNR